MCIPSNGEIVPADHACPGEIVILADDTLKLKDVYKRQVQNGTLVRGCP